MPRAASSPAVPERFARAVDALATGLREDRSVLAAILCGSLSHDTVWEKSDVDLVLVTIDDPKVKEQSVSLYADGVNVHALLLPRSGLRKVVEGELRNSFMHSFLAKGRLLYTHDETIPDMLASLRDIGERDTHVQLLRTAMWALPYVYKARKFLHTRGDLDYTATWLLGAATALARVEVLAAGLIADREVLPQAHKLNPEFFDEVYIGLLNTKKTPATVKRALAAIEEYLASRAPKLFGLILEHLAEAGESRSCTEIEEHFARHHGIEGITTACEYLADQGLIGKSAVTRPLTRRSTASVQELAFHGIR